MYGTRFLESISHYSSEPMSSRHADIMRIVIRLLPFSIMRILVWPRSHSSCPIHTTMNPLPIGSMSDPHDSLRVLKERLDRNG